MRWSGVEAAVNVPLPLGWEADKSKNKTVPSFPRVLVTLKKNKEEGIRKALAS